MLLRIGEQLFARQQIPFAPGSDDLDIGHQRISAEFEAYLVVALAGGTVRNGVGTSLARDLDQTLGNQRPRNRSAEQVFALINRVAAEHRQDEVADELLTQIVDENVLRLDTELQRLAARRLQFLALTEIGGEGHYLAVVGVLQPLENDRGIEAARIGENNFLGFTHCIFLRDITGCGRRDDNRHRRQ